MCSIKVFQQNSKTPQYSKSLQDECVLCVAIVQTLRYDTILVYMKDLFSFIFLCCGMLIPPFSRSVSFNFKRQHWPVHLTKAIVLVV